MTKKSDVLTFPKNFLWGAATSAEQSEGRKGVRKAKTIYDLHYAAKPEDFYEKVDASITSDAITHFKTDVGLMKKMNFNTFRTSISWARVFPDGMDKPANKEAVAWYHSYFDECASKGIEAIVTLFHFDLPEYEVKKGGWASQEVIDDFVKYADFIFAEFQSKINKFVTMNEPHRPAINGFLTGRHWPLKKGDLKGFVASAFGISLAHSMAVNLFNAKFRKANNQIGGIFDARRTYPLTNSPEDKAAARFCELLFYYGMVDPMVGGWYDKEVVNLIKQLEAVPPLATQKNLNEMARTRLDFVGVNFYGPLRARAVPKDSQTADHPYGNLFELAIPKTARMNKHRGIEIWPQALYDVCLDIWKRHGLPIYCSENGIGVEEWQMERNDRGEIQDDYRIVFIEEHLKELHKLIEQGVPIFGYHLWASLDCWSFINGYKNRYGFIEVDTKTQQRRLKKSAYWFGELAKTNGFTPTGKLVEDVLNFDKTKFTRSG